MQWDLWTGSVDPLRSVDPSNFYDLQARSMLPGHLDVPKGSLGIDAFVHAGHAYTYFGIFPSLLRMPILVLTTRFDGRLTAPSMLVGWLLVGLFTSLLFWRARVIMVPSARTLSNSESSIPEDRRPNGFRPSGGHSYLSETSRTGSS